MAQPCPHCPQRMQTLHTRTDRNGGGTRRRYECPSCKWRLTTIETVIPDHARLTPRRTVERRERA